MTGRSHFQDKPLLKITALNAVLRGWITYYRNCNAKEVAKDLDFWVNQRLFIWLRNRHRLPIRQILTMYKLRQEGKRYNCGIRNGAHMLFLYRMSDQPITRISVENASPPLLDGQLGDNDNGSGNPGPELRLARQCAKQRRMANGEGGNPGRTRRKV